MDARARGADAAPTFHLPNAYVANAALMRGDGNTTSRVVVAQCDGGKVLNAMSMSSVMSAFGPRVVGLRKQVDALAAFNDASKATSESASDGSQATTHRDEDDDRRESGAEVRQQTAATTSAPGRPVAAKAALVNGAGDHRRASVAKQARYEALVATPDRAATATPGIESPGAAADVLLAMMACGSEEDVAIEDGGRRRARPDHMGALSTTFPKKRRTMNAVRARSNLTPYAGPAVTATVSVIAETPTTFPTTARAVTKASLEAGIIPKAHRPWRLDEVKALVRGVSHYGRGQWADIKALRSDNVAEALINRSAVDLKDKWRNLLRVAMLPALYKRREVNGVPLEILEQVRALASSKSVPAVTEGRPNAAKGQENRAPTTNPSQNVVAVKAASPSITVENSAMLNAKGARRSKHHSPWTLAETKALVDGVEKCGGCRWTIIKKSDDPALERRTAMDLKDKWRNLLQLASLPVQSRRKQETPPDFLDRVLELESSYGNARRKGRKTVEDE